MAKAEVCPNCGHCPTCGRSNRPSVVPLPYYPTPYWGPYWSYPYTYSTGTVTVTQGDAVTTTGNTQYINASA